MGKATPVPVFTPENQRVSVIAAAQQVFGVVDPGLRKPACAGHPVAIFEHRRAAFAEHPAFVPDGGPEGLGLGDRPAPEAGVIRAVDLPAPVDGYPEGIEPATGDTLGAAGRQSGSCAIPSSSSVQANRSARRRSGIGTDLPVATSIQTIFDSPVA
jgi:hypothetical protein